MRRLYFPLRSSVELFSDPSSIEAGARAKEAAVLYDEIVFEAGLFEVQLLEEGSFSNWRPPESLSPEDLANSRKLHPPGSNFTLAMGKQVAEGVPAPVEEMRSFLSGPIVTSYAAEWHSEAIDDLREINPDWAKYAVVEDGGEALRGLRGPIAAAEHVALELSRESKMNPWAGAFAAKALARDATVAADMEAAFSVTSLFEPLVMGLDARPDPAGRVALGLLLPQVGRLPWEAIAEYRQHPGSEDARGKLREFEERATAAEADDPLEFQAELFQAISADLFGAIDDLQGELVKELAVEAANTAVSFIPLVGQVLGPGASLVRAIGNHMSEKRTWYAALMKLHGQRP